LEDRLIQLMREETYLRFGGQFRSGKLHTAKLWKQRLGVYRLFERPVRAERSIAFSVLVDESASMKGQEKFRLAAKTAILLGETLDHLDVPLEIIGYSTAEYEARAAMALGLTPAYEYRTMRCSALEHRIYKAFDEPYRAARARLSEIQPRHNNWDEESVIFASRRLRARREQTKVLLVISDGQPNGDAEHLVRALAEAERSGCKVVGLGIGADFVRRIYRNAIVVEGFRQTGEELLRLLARELRGGGQARAGSQIGDRPLAGWRAS
jgi:cobaltochelatase CobT